MVWYTTLCGELLPEITGQIDDWCSSLKLFYIELQGMSWIIFNCLETCRFGIKLTLGAYIVDVVDLKLFYFTGYIFICIFFFSPFNITNYSWAGVFVSSLHYCGDEKGDIYISPLSKTYYFVFN